MDRALRRTSAAAGYVAAVATATLVLTLLHHLPEGPEHWSSDLRTAWLSHRPETQHPRIVLVSITDKTLERYPYASPTDRQLLADLVRKVDAEGAKTIGLDIVLNHATEPSKDESLLQAVRNARAQIALGAIDDRSFQTPADSLFQSEFLARAERPIGHLYFDEHHSALVISDHVIRKTGNESDHPEQRSFAEVVAETEGSIPPLKSSYISWLLSPKDGSETFLSLPAEHVLGRGGLSQQLPLKDLFQGKIVLIGGDFFDRDQHVTPLSVLSEKRYPGLFIHAQILAQLLDGRSIREMSWSLLLLTLLLASGVGFWIGLRSGHKHLFVELLGHIELDGPSFRVYGDALSFKRARVPSLAASEK